MKIFGLGLSRTGTTSLGLGLEQLGFRVTHFPIDIFSKNKIEIYNQFDAFVDLPIPLYYKELDIKFPGSKFILTTRDEKKWLESMKWMLTDGKIIWRHGKVHEQLHQVIYKTDQYNEDLLLQCYRSYNHEVLTYFKNRSDDFIHIKIEENELNYNILCNFLNVPILLNDFPKANEKRAVNIWHKIEYFLWCNLPIYKKIRYHFIRLIK